MDGGRGKYQIKIRHKAEKNLYSKIPRPWRNRIRRAIEVEMIVEYNK